MRRVSAQPGNQTLHKENRQLGMIVGPSACFCKRCDVECCDVAGERVCVTWLRPKHIVPSRRRHGPCKYLHRGVISCVRTDVLR